MTDRTELDVPVGNLVRARVARANFASSLFSSRVHASGDVALANAWNELCLKIALLMDGDLAAVAGADVVTDMSFVVLDDRWQVVKGSSPAVPDDIGSARRAPRPPVPAPGPDILARLVADRARRARAEAS